ncbi:DUF2777 family protein [Geomicrobium sediminis]|uniref:DUF2777 domain-containing protein n=1 Tax=Geomicrobium sediminis TaxID=1347788 RepID=A0ABS2PDS2_9BACL|nr:DUF2777 family protein [Geomicrobium sediminis]MBM7633476.1 hypothetical protein [Geomicrobium sediminis]
MNRKEAHLTQGKTVVFTEQNPKCSYYGVLQHIETPKNKIWTGKIVVQGVYEIHNADDIFSLHYSGGEEVDVTGDKISTFSGKVARSFRSSTLMAIAKLEKSTNANIHQLEEKKRQLQENRLRLKNGHRTSEDPYLYFKLQSIEDEVVLVEQSQSEQMMLDGCPFDLEWLDSKKDEWQPVNYDQDFKFRLKSGKKVRLKEGSIIRIHKEQFEPFQILLNELELPAKESLAVLLRDFGFKRKHLVKCHNTLLRQLLHAQEEHQFSGVNFLFFQKDGNSIVIQHRYERILHQVGEDYVYDRFECTSDTNQRQVVTYTNMQQPSK